MRRVSRRCCTTWPAALASTPRCVGRLMRCLSRERKKMNAKLLLAVCLMAAATPCQAVIDGFHQLNIDLTNADDANAKATWSDPKINDITKNGLGWDGDSAAERDSWIQTKPMALGLSWRPTYAISVRAAVYP